MSLQEEIERLEGLIADRRELYNDQVYRTTPGSPRSRPSCWPGCSAGQARPFFEASEADRQRPEATLETES